jgi:signal transduction histidine kinase
MYNTPRYDSSTINSNLEKTGTYSVDITPPANFLRVIEDTGYNIAQASSDISDNSTDAGATKINLVIKSENKTPTVIIADNGTGMNSDTLCGAMVLGASNGELGSKQKGNYGDNMSGKFGTGLKTT